MVYPTATTTSAGPWGGVMLDDGLTCGGEGNGLAKGAHAGASFSKGFLAIDFDGGLACARDAADRDGLVREEGEMSEQCL